MANTYQIYHRTVSAKLNRIYDDSSLFEYAKEYTSFWSSHCDKNVKYIERHCRKDDLEISKDRKRKKKKLNNCKPGPPKLINMVSNLNRQRLQSCIICIEIMKLQNTHQLNKVTDLKEFFARIPISFTGIILAWIKLKETFPSLKHYNISPIQIYIHFFMRVCPSQLMTNTKNVMFDGVSLTAAIYWSLVLNRKKTKILTTRQKHMYLAIKYLVKNYCKQHMGTCTDSKNPCLYSNDGNLTEIINKRNLLFDGRLLISRFWFQKTLSQTMSPNMFYNSDVTYGAAQPGACRIDYNRGREISVLRLQNQKRRIYKIKGWREHIKMFDKNQEY